jgi:hypothetical protein
MLIPCIFLPDLLHGTGQARKGESRLMKLFHNKLLGKILAVLFGLAAALYFAWTFSYFGLWLEIGRAHV